MNDYIIRGIDKTKSLRFFAANTTNLVETLTTRHGLSPVACAALGRTLTATAIMAHMTKNDDDRVSILIKGDGPIKGIIAEANGKGDVKGYVYNPNVDIPKNELGKLDVRGAIGNAILTVTKDLGFKEPYVGQTAMISGEIAEDIADYFLLSEQTNTAVILGVLINKEYSIECSGGIIIQVLPDAKDEAISYLEEKLKEFSSLTTYLKEGKTIEDIIKMLIDGPEIFSISDLRFKCDCSKERMERALISLGKKEIAQICDDDQEDVELVCHFCNEKYEFDKSDLRKIIEEI